MKHILPLSELNKYNFFSKPDFRFLRISPAIALFIFVVLTLFSSCSGEKKKANSTQETDISVNQEEEQDTLKPATEQNLQNSVIRKTEVFESSNTSGFVGISDKKPLDNPVDNVFHISVDQPIESGDKVWLEYELWGVADYTGIPKSINSCLSKGGYFVQRKEAWTSQRELINPAIIKSGDNVIRFGITSKADYGYQIRDVKLRIEPQDESSSAGRRQLVVNIPDKRYYYGTTGYLEGFVTGKDAQKAKIYIGDEKVWSDKGNFESLVKKSVTDAEQWSVPIKAVFPDGEELLSEAVFKKPGEWSVQNGFDRTIHQREKRVNPDAGFLVQLGHVKLSGDAGSVNKATNVSVTALRDIDVPALDAGMVNVTANHKGYRFLPDGTEFNDFVSLEMGYDTTLIPNGYSEDDIRTFYFDDKTHHWISIPKDTLLLASNSLVSRTHHFTDYINGIIKVPESPETQGYTPTSLKDVKAANPATGINLIQPPSANPMGNANLSYPINIPAGRQGMQPQLAISYNSGGGNGWLGLGWDLSVPSITVDTRWGVPRYDTINESETYLMMGEQLSPLAHKGEKILREKNKRFYPRVEGSFNKIIRKGDEPENYYWIVTDKSGVKYYYGCYDESGQNSELVLRGQKGVAEWYLGKIMDLYGNTVTYYYQNVEYEVASDHPFNNGKYRYPKRINYTGHNDSEGVYSVHFSLQNTIKKDASIRANYGFKVVDGYLLDKIDVKYNQEQVRSYELLYSEGAFFKTLLDSIVEYNSKGERFYAHGFTYYDNVRNEGTYEPFNSSTTNYTLGNQEVNGDYVFGIAKGSALGTSQGNTWGGGLYGGFGLGSNTTSKSLTVGGSYNYTQSKNYSISTLVDINGDRLPDKVFVDNDALYYRAQRKDGTFGDKKSISGGRNFQETVSKSNMGGFEANLVRSISAGVSKRKTRTTTSRYFSDVNSDGLIDIVVKGKVFYNYVDDKGEPNFTDKPEELPFDVPTSNNLDKSLLLPAKKDYEETLQQNPLHDIIRMWEAPYDGVIAISGGVQLLGDCTANNNLDGIKVSIQKDEMVLWSDLISPSNHTEQNPKDVDNISVSKGDIIHFRLQSVFNGLCDKVYWSPQITYTDKDTLIVDANGLKRYVFDAKEDFLLNSNQTTSLAFKGKIKLKSSIIKPQTTDDINVSFLILDSLNQVVWEDTATYSWDSIVHINRNEDIPVEQNDMQFLVKVGSNSNVDWSKIKVNTHIYYTESDNEAISQESLTDANGSPNYEYFPVPDYQFFHKQPTYTSNLKVFEQNGKVEAEALTSDSFEVREPDSRVKSDSFCLSIKTENELIAKGIITIIEDSINAAKNITARQSIEANKPLYIEYNSPDVQVDQILSDSAILRFYIPDTTYFKVTEQEFDYEDNAKDTTIRTRQEIEEVDGTFPQVTTEENETEGYVLTTTIAIDTLIQDVLQSEETIEITKNYRSPLEGEKGKFGQLYRNWGQYALTGKTDKIISDDLTLDIEMDNEEIEGDINSKLDDAENSQDDSFEEQEESYGNMDMNMMEKPFAKAIPDGKRGVWTGYDEQVYLTADTMQSGRRGEKDLIEWDLLTQNILNSDVSGIRAINKYSSSSSKIINALGQSNVKSNSTIYSEFMDMNGDGYPDIIGNGKIQYSLPDGSLSDNSQPLASVSNSSSNIKHRTLNPQLVSDYKKSVVAIKNVAKPNSAVMPSSSPVSIDVGSDQTQEYDTYSIQDINGDGLPDRVYQNGEVELNYGYSFGKKEKWGYEHLRYTTSRDVTANLGGSAGSVGFGLSIDAETGELKGGSLQYSRNSGSFVAGVGATTSESHPNIQFMDVNSDGLADWVYTEPGDNPQTRVRLNNGSGFGEEEPWKGMSAYSNQRTINADFNAAATFGIGFTIVVVPVKIVFNPTFTHNESFNRTVESLIDINGDGYPDYVRSARDNKASAKLSTIAATNLLQRVENPLGGSFTIRYEQEGNTYRMPNPQWVLSDVEIYDGHNGDGVDVMKTRFEYSDGYYDRFERAFYGFGEVKTHQLDEKGEVYRSTLRTFANDNYYSKGLLTSETLLDSEENKYVETVNKYELLDSEIKPLDEPLNSFEVIFPALKETQKYFYEGEDSPQKQTWMSFEYGDYGNVEGYTDYGDPDDDSDNLTSTIMYWELSDRHILSVPKSITVEDSKETFRERSTQVDDNTGKIIQISQSYEDGAAVYDLFYDDYGNLDSIVHPKNYKEERMYFAYDYDDEVHSYVTAVRDAYGYSSLTTYDYRFGQVKSTTDINGQQTTYKIDDLGRITHITGPYELASGEDYTILFEYHPDAEIPWAHTYHFDPEHPENKIETSIFIDGLGRVLQTKKDAALFKKKNAPDKEVMVASGKVEYDALGRSVASWYPVIDEEREPSAFIEKADSVAPTTLEYDVMDRALITTLPDGAKTETEYGFGKDREDELQFMITVEDANGKVTSSFKDIRGRQTAVKSPGEVWTSFVYNPIGELLEATDDEGNTTFSTYDDLGRRLSRNHPDAGLTEYVYDAAGNMRKQVTANLRETNQEIVYTYDYNRPTGIEYPQNSINNVKYEYGEPGADFNRAGRVVLQEDATGAQEFFYGPLGEVVKNIRTIIVPEEGVFTFETEWEYDTWNRLKHMTYPDGEELTYNYNTGGLLLNMHGEKKGHLYDYLSQIGYDKFEDRRYLSYGNGTETTYEYESDRRRLHHIEALTSAGRKMMDNTYIYDNVNNITGLKSEAPIPSADLKGGRFEYNYEYDDLYRLTAATGHYEGATHEHKYTLSMDYSTTGRILHKGQEHTRRGYDDVDWAPRHKTTYDWEYRYEGEKPHAPSQIGENTYAYDANGNTTGWQSTKNKQRRDILWDEENRMRAIADNGVAHHYMYDASGQRVIKATGDGQAVYVNGFPMAGSGTVGNYTMYVNPFMVVSNMKFTKHFYIEGQRIVSKIGEMGEYQDMLNPKDTLKAGGDKVNWDKKKDNQKAQLIANFEALGLDGALFTAGKSGKVPYGRIKKYFRENDGLVNGGDSPANMDTISTGGNKPEKLQFYYHPDHLGSSSYITDISGEVYQHTEYFPFGETFIEERTDAEYTSYLFNGKELDEETGLYYYGARYYDPRISMWYGVDPLAEKHPELSPFLYVLNNPLRYIDPDGRTEKERKKAVARANQYVNKNSKPSSSSYGYAGLRKGIPGKPIDCSGLVSEAANYSGFGHLNKGNGSKGVINIVNNSRAASFNDMEEGNLVTFRSGKHIAIVAGDIAKDKDGNVVSFSIVHSTSSKGPIESTIMVDGSGTGYDGWWDDRLDTDNVYQWDTQETSPEVTESEKTYIGGTLPEVTVVGKGETIKEPIGVDKINLTN